MSFVLVAMRTIHGTLKRLLCALYYRYRTCCVVHAGRWCAPSCVDADKTWSITGALGVMAAALPARAGLRYLLTAVGAFVGMSLVHTGSRRLLGVQRSTVRSDRRSRFHYSHTSCSTQKLSTTEALVPRANGYEPWPRRLPNLVGLRLA